MKRIFVLFLVFVLSITGCASQPDIDLGTVENFETEPFEEVDGLKIYYLTSPIDWREASIAFMPIGIGISAVDSPMPGPADALAILVWGSLTVGYVVYTQNAPVGAVYYDDLQDLSATLSYYIPVTQDHNMDHTVIVGSTNVATQIFLDLQKRWPPDPNENDELKRIVCYVMRHKEVILRYLVWAGTNYSSSGLPRGNLTWWQYAPSGQIEVYGYSGKSLRTMENLPQDLANQDYSIEPIPCDRLQPPFHLLAGN